MLWSLSMEGREGAAKEAVAELQDRKETLSNHKSSRGGLPADLSQQ